MISSKITLNRASHASEEALSSNHRDNISNSYKVSIPNAEGVASLLDASASITSRASRETCEIVGGDATSVSFTDGNSSEKGNDSGSALSVDAVSSPYDADIGLDLLTTAQYRDPDDKIQLKQIDRIAQQKLRQVDGIDELFLALALTDTLSLAGPAIASVLSLAAQRAVQAGANGAAAEAKELQELVVELKDQRREAKVSMQAITEELEKLRPDITKVQAVAQEVLDRSPDSDDSSLPTLGSSDSHSAQENLPPMKRLLQRTQDALNKDILKPADKEQIMQAVATATSEYQQANDGKNATRMEAFFMKNFGAPAMGLMSMGMFLLAGTAAAKFASDLGGQEISELGQIADPGNTLGDITGVSKIAATGVFGAANSMMAVFALSKVATGTANHLKLGQEKRDIAKMDGISDKAKTLLKDRKNFDIEINRWDGPLYGVPTAVGQALFAYSAVLEFAKNIPGPPGKNLLATILQAPAIPAMPLTLGPAIIRARQETREGKHEGNPDKVKEDILTNGKDVFQAIRHQVKDHLERSLGPIDTDDIDASPLITGDVLASEMKVRWEQDFVQASADIAKTKALSLMHHAVTKEPNQPESRRDEADRLMGHGTNSTWNVGVKKRFMTVGLKADIIPIVIHPSQRTTIRDEVQKDMQRQYGDAAQGDRQLRRLLEDSNTPTEIYRNMASELGVNSASEMLERLKEFENDGNDPLGKLGQSLALNVLNTKPAADSPEKLRDNSRQAWQKLSSIAEKAYFAGNTPAERVAQFRRATQELSQTNIKRGTRSAINLTKKGARGLRSRIPGLQSQQPMSNPLLSKSRLKANIRTEASRIVSGLSDADLTALFSADCKEVVRQKMNQKAVDSGVNTANRSAESMQINAENLLAQHHLVDIAAIVYKKIDDPTQRMLEMEKLVAGKGELIPDLMAKLTRQNLPEHFLRNAKNQFKADKAAFEGLFETLGEGEFLFEKQKMTLSLGYSKPVVVPSSQAVANQQAKTLTQAKAEKEMLRLISKVYDSVEDPDERLGKLDALINKPSVLNVMTASKRAVNRGLSRELKNLFAQDKDRYEALLSTNKGRSGNNQENRKFAKGLNRLVTEAGYLVSEQRQSIVDPSKVTPAPSSVANPRGVFSHRPGESKQQYVFDLNRYTETMADAPNLEEAFWRDATSLLIKVEKNQAKVTANAYEEALPLIHNFGKNYKDIKQNTEDNQLIQRGRPNREINQTVEPRNDNNLSIQQDHPSKEDSFLRVQNGNEGSGSPVIDHEDGLEHLGSPEDIKSLASHGINDGSDGSDDQSVSSKDTFYSANSIFSNDNAHKPIVTGLPLTPSPLQPVAAQTAPSSKPSISREEFINKAKNNRPSFLAAEAKILIQEKSNTSNARELRRQRLSKNNRPSFLAAEAKIPIQEKSNTSNALELRKQRLSKNKLTD